MTIADLIVNDMSYEKHHPTLSLLIDSSKTSKLEELLLEWKLEMGPKSSSLKIDEGDRLLSADALNDGRREPDELPLRCAESRLMRECYFPQLLHFFSNGIGPV
jgi:hypothetical protein